MLKQCIVVVLLKGLTSVSLTLLLMRIKCSTGSYLSYPRNKFVTKELFVRDELPDLNEMLGPADIRGKSFDTLGCTIDSKQDGCVWTFFPDSTCQQKLLLNKVFGLLTKEDENSPSLDSLTKTLFPPGAFSVTKFIIHRCGTKVGNVEFKCKALKQFDVVKEKMRLTKGMLSLKFNYEMLKKNFLFSMLSIDIKGSVEMVGQAFPFELKKAPHTTISKFKCNAAEIEVAKYFNLFSSDELVTELDVDRNEKNLIKSGGLFSEMILQNPTISGVRYEGGYEIVAKGATVGVEGFEASNGYLVVQKNNEGTVGVAVFVSNENMKLTDALMLVLGKSFEGLRIINNITMDLTIEYASKNISNLKDPELREVLTPSVVTGVSLTKGTTINGELPEDDILQNSESTTRSTNDENVLIQVAITKHVLSLKFLGKRFNDGKKLLTLLAPKAAKYLNKYVFKGELNVVLSQYNVEVSTSKVDMSVYLPKTVYIGDRLFGVVNGNFEMEYDVLGKFSFKLKAELQIAKALADITVEKKGTLFQLRGAILSTTSTNILKTFGSVDLVEQTVKRSKTFEFDVRDIVIEATMGGDEGQKIRITGTPMLFGWDNLLFETFVIRTPVSEFLRRDGIRRSVPFVDRRQQTYHHEDAHPVDYTKIYKRNIASNNTKEIVTSATVAETKIGMAVLMKDVQLEEILEKVFQTSVMGTNWIYLDLALVISNSNENHFLTPDIKAMIRRAIIGVYFRGTMSIPKNCMRSQLCEFCKKMMKPDSNLFVSAGFRHEGFFLRAGYEEGPMDFGDTVKLDSVYLFMNLGLKSWISIHGKMTVTIQEDPLSFEVSIGLTGAATIQLTGKMTRMWKNPFGIKDLAIGNTRLTVGLQLPAFVPVELVLGGQFKLGINGKELLARAVGSINVVDPTANYVYAKISNLTLGRCAAAFGYDTNLPRVVTDTGFPNGLMVAFSTNPSGIRLKQFDRTLQPGFTMQGIINILGYSIECKVIVRKLKLYIDIDLPLVNINDGALMISRSNEDKTRGPKLYVHLSLTKAKVYIEGNISVLGISSETLIYIGSRGLKIHLYGSLFGIVTANLTIRAPYVKKMLWNDLSFSVSSCFSTDLSDATKNANDLIKDAADKSKEVVALTEKNVEKQATWYDKVATKLKGVKDTLVQLKGKMSEIADVIESHEKEINVSCKAKCKNVAGFWTNLWCTGKCWLHKNLLQIQVVGNSILQKAHDSKYNILIGIIEASENMARKAKTIINSFETAATNVGSYVKAGIKASKDLLISGLKSLIEINHLCFNTSLATASGACFKVSINATLLKKNRAHRINLCFQYGYLSAIGKAISEFFYPTITQVDEKIKETTLKFKDTEDEEKKLDKNQESTDEEILKLQKEINDLSQPDNEDNKREIIHHNRTILEMRRQMYKEQPSLTLNDEDAIYSLDLSPNYMKDISITQKAAIPFDIAAIVHELSSVKGECDSTKSLVKTYQKIADHLTSLFDHLQNEKNRNKKDSGDMTKHFDSLAHEFLAKCKRAKCSEKKTNDIYSLAHKFAFAHHTRVKNLDVDFEGIGKRMLRKTSVSFIKEIRKNSLTVESFLTKLHDATKVASQKKSVGMLLNTAYNAVRELISQDNLYAVHQRSFSNMKNDMAFLRANVPCAA